MCGRSNRELGTLASETINSSPTHCSDRWLGILPGFVQGTVCCIPQLVVSVSPPETRRCDKGLDGGICQPGMHMVDPASPSCCGRGSG